MTNLNRLSMMFRRLLVAVLAFMFLALGSGPVRAMVVAEFEEEGIERFLEHEATRPSEAQVRMALQRHGRAPAPCRPHAPRTLTPHGVAPAGRQAWSHAAARGPPPPARAPPLT